MSITLESIKEEQYSMTHSEWVNIFVGTKIKEITYLIQQKKNRLEHCINFVENDSIHTDGEKVWIESPGKENWYVDKDSDTEAIFLFIDFFSCTQEKISLPKEIEELDNILVYLYNF